MNNKKVRIIDVSITIDTNDDFIYREIFVYDYDVDFEVVSPKCLKASMIKLLNEDYVFESNMGFYTNIETYVRDVCDDVKIKS